MNNEESKEILEWETDDSILQYLKANLNEDGSLNESAEKLPDEKKADDEIQFAPGLMDAMFGADESEESKSRIKQLVNLIKRVAKNGDDQSKSDFYREITENESVIGIIDEFLQSLVIPSRITAHFDLISIFGVSQELKFTSVAPAVQQIRKPNRIWCKYEPQGQLEPLGKSV